MPDRAGLGVCVDEPWSEIRLHIDVIDNSIGLTGAYVHGSGASAHLGGVPAEADE
ncbi:hypothetical protein LJR235_000640 [Pararhizobium sp. LjRoot235]|uniref:hypothetical protein n=1 Tax=Pararhizobium sp. LjRoot235 TaxID=3342291 RepID=UPI003ECD74F5